VARGVISNQYQEPGVRIQQPGGAGSGMRWNIGPGLRQAGRQTLFIETLITPERPCFARLRADRAQQLLTPGSSFSSAFWTIPAITPGVNLWQKLSLLAVATWLFPFVASAQELASKYHYDGIYKGTVQIDLLVNGNDKHRAKAQAVFYPDGRLLVLTVESPQVPNPMNIKGVLRKNVFTGNWKKGLFGTALSFQAAFHSGSAVVTISGKSKRSEKWFFTKVSGA
jgi:hypothetical protein